MLDRKLCLVFVGLLVAVCCSYGDYTVDWSDQAGTSSLYDSTGFNVGTNAATPGFLFELVMDVGGDTSVSDMIANNTLVIGGTAGYGASDDQVVDSGNWNVIIDGVLGAFSGSFADTTASYTNTSFYIRFFDASTESGAGFGGLIYNTLGNWVTQADPGPEPPSTPDSTAVNFDITNTDLAGTTSFADGWQTTIAVPEPGTLMLFALGLLTLVSSKRRRH